MAAIRAGCDMDEVTGIDRFEPVPHTAWHDVRIARSKQNGRLEADRPLVTVVKNQFHRSAHDVQELVTVRVDLATMRSRPIDVGDRSDCVSIDSPWRSWRGRCDGNRPVTIDVRNTPFEVDRRRVRGNSHAHRLPDPVRTARKFPFLQVPQGVPKCAIVPMRSGAPDVGCGGGDVQRSPTGFGPDLLLWSLDRCGSVLCERCRAPHSTGHLHWDRAALPPVLDGLVYVSGVAELICAFGLWRRKRWAGYAAAFLLLVLWPANVQDAITTQEGHDVTVKVVTWFRIPLQIPLIWFAFNRVERDLSDLLPAKRDPVRIGHRAGERGHSKPIEISHRSSDAPAYVGRRVSRIRRAKVSAKASSPMTRPTQRRPR
jgi:uncharacterized membrane protein